MSDQIGTTALTRVLRSPLTVISPHLDDAVLSCAQVLAAHPGSTVITIFAGRPEDGRLSAWDEASFRSGEDPMAIRQREDRAALGALGATAVHLQFLDEAYGPSADLDEVAEELGRQIDAVAPRTVLLPLGISHADHERTHQAAIRLIRDRPHIRWVTYEDLPYRFEYYEAVHAQKAALFASGLRLSELHLPSDARKRVKLRAIRCYGSQIKPLGWKRVLRSLLAEQYWQIRIAPSES